MSGIQNLHSNCVYPIDSLKYLKESMVYPVSFLRQSYSLKVKLFPTSRVFSAAIGGDPTGISSSSVTAKH